MGFGGMYTILEVVKGWNESNQSEENYLYVNSTDIFVCNFPILCSRDV